MKYEILSQDKEDNIKEILSAIPFIIIALTWIIYSLSLELYIKILLIIIVIVLGLLFTFYLQRKAKKIQIKP